MNNAFFLDRDGVLNTMVYRMGKLRAPYTPEEFSIFPMVGEALTALKERGYRLIVVTNQPDVARGWVGKDAVEMVNDKIRQLLPVDDIEVCYHTEKDNCDCRKPEPGMLLRAASKWDICLPESYMVGDRFSDIQAGDRAGCRTILIGSGGDEAPIVQPQMQMNSLWEAVQAVLQNS
ncbi:MAG TPA: HAD family hydrolase [Bacteriovoracaceae bacterium]|nr:HAD family hydrolase [Bacteriovoracaceae bacterium]